MTADYQQYFKAFADVSKAIHSGMETEEILGRIVASITEAMMAKRLHLLDCRPRGRLHCPQGHQRI